MTNLTSGGSVEQIVSLCQAGVLRPFCDLMAAKDEKTVAVVLGKDATTIDYGAPLVGGTANTIHL